MDSISKLIILFSYSTSSPKIITNRYMYFFSLYSIPNYFTVLGIIQFLVTPLSAIALNLLVTQGKSPVTTTRVGTVIIVNKAFF